MPPSVTSLSGHAPSSVAGGGTESTDQGPARNTYSMQVYGTLVYSAWTKGSISPWHDLVWILPCDVVRVIMVMCAYGVHP
jgi:hypothetical protein